MHKHKPKHLMILKSVLILVALHGAFCRDIKSSSIIKFVENQEQRSLRDILRQNPHQWFDDLRPLAYPVDFDFPLFF